MWWETWGSSQVVMEIRGYLLSGNKGVSRPLKLHQKLRVLLYLLLETWGFLESCHRGLRAPLEVQREISVPLDL